MAYITKAEVTAKQAQLKAVNKKYGMTARFSGSNSSTLVLRVSGGSIDVFADRVKDKEPRTNMQVNHYYMDDNFKGKTLAYLKECYAIMLAGHFDESDAMTDYFNCAWYNSINFGDWNKPYKLA